METGKPGLVSAPVHMSSVAAQAEKRMDIQTPLRAVYIHTVPALPAQPYPQPPAAVREPATLHLAMPSLYSNETLPFLTIHIADGLQSQAGLSVAAGAPASRPKSAGKHVCPHCGRDCMKPSVLEKHLRCHTGERPYPCATCGVSFKTQSNLYKHKRTQAHARLSSESEQSSLGSLDSMSSSRETCTSSLSLDEHADESESTERDDRLPATACPAHTTRAQGSTSEQNELATARQKTEPNESAKVRVEEEKQKVESEKAPLSVSRHLPLQRQEATLFSKQWESSVSGGKPQSHESTDSGFSESNDHYPSPASVLPDHSMDSLPESTKEHLEETTITDTASELGQGGQEPKDAARDQEQKTLVERISKLISENTAVVEDKQLDNVRPRKTVLSKQGSIDLPMPYTYKDSFHFDMKIGKTSNVGLQRNRAPGLYSSVPTQRSTAAEHVPLGRSNSLPFSVTLLQPEKSSPASSHHSDYATLVRRGSSGQITPSFTMKPVNQQSSTHRPLVRQTAVDCNHATDGHFINSSVEEAGSGSLSCDGDGGESCAEPSSRKFRRKKAQKFAYNKWYMYGGGTFKKLYNAEKSGDNTVIKSRKCLNPDLEVIQSPHKRLSAVHKEMATTGGVTSSSTVSPAGCPPAKPSFVHTSGMNCDLMSINSPLKAPLQRNLSLSGLPLSSVGSFVSLIKSNVSGTDTERLIHDGSTSLFRAHIPSDRKKQKTDDKAVFPVLNAVTHPLPSVTGRVPQQETNRTSVNFPENQKHTQVKDAVFLPRIIDANVPSVSASPAASVSSAAKTSFLPKYQLKLPNVTETDSNSSSHLADKPSTTDVCAFASSHTEQNSPLDTTSENACKESVFSPLSQTCDLKKTDAFSSTQTQCVPPGTTTLCPTKTSPLYESVTSSLPGAHRQFAATTVTTTCLKDDQAGICSTLVQPSKSAAGSALIRFPTRAAPVVANMPGRPTVNTANEDFVGHPTFNRPSSHSQPAAALNPATRAYVGQNTPAVPCNVAPFNQEQAVSQNIFHVHTADLQICLQLISDEQLALIEPQIEREAANSHPQRRETEALAHVIQNKAQISEMSSEGRGRQLPGHQAETDQSGPLPTVNAGSKKPPLSVHFGKLQSNIHVSEPSDCSIISAESKPPESLGLTLRPHTHSDVSTATEALSSGGDVVSTAASLIGEKHQTSHEEQSVNESQFLSQTLSCPPHLSMTCSSPSTVKQSSTSSDLLLKEGREKPQVAVAKGEGPVRKSHRPQESGRTHSSVQVVVSQASGSLCADPPEDVDLCRQTHRAGPSNDAAPLQKTIPHGAKDSIDLAQAEEQLGPNAAASCKTLVEKPKDTPAVLPGFQSCAAGVMEAASPVACAGQTKPQDVGHGGTPGLPDSADGRRRLSRDAGGTNQQGAEGQGGESVMGEDEDGGVQAHQGEDLKVKEESFKNSWLSEQHLSQTHSGMCEYPPQSPQQAPSSSHNPSPSRRSHTSLFNLPQPPLDTNYFYFSQQQWESSVAHNYQTLTPCQSKLDEHIKAQARLTEAQRESSSQQTEILSHEEQQEQQQTMSIQQGNSIKGNSAAGSYCSRITLGSLSPGVKTSTDHFHVSPPAEGIKGTADWTGNSNNSDPGRSDTSNKYQPFLLTGHSFQPGECLNNGVRVVPNCQDYSEDTCSSDEEGKLIIEL